MLPFGGFWLSLSIVAGAAWLLLFLIWANRASLVLPSGLLQEKTKTVRQALWQSTGSSLPRLRSDYR